ncbi:MAG: hypothetical protein J5835_07275 [Bacteroidales bacterium]|nr:hypothetical protein [Bacteroidales bacterium]
MKPHLISYDSWLSAALIIALHRDKNLFVSHETKKTRPDINYNRYYQFYRAIRKPHFCGNYSLLAVSGLAFFL